MDAKNGFLFLTLLTTTCVFFSKHAHAVVFPDQEVRAGAAVSATEDENADASSRFGSFNQQKRQANSMIVRPLSPISNSSFESSPDRVPASSPAAAEGRNPAGAVDGVIVHKPMSTNKKAIMRHAKATQSYQEVAVIANDLGFFPSTIFVTQGIPVRMFITGASQKAQCFMLDQFGVRRQIRNQKIEEVTFTPDEGGTFSFNCPMNGARGSVVVKELEVSPNDRLPASVQVSHAESSVPVQETEKKTDIKDDDFTPEFRN